MYILFLFFAFGVHFCLSCADATQNVLTSSCWTDNTVGKPFTIFSFLNVHGAMKTLKIGTSVKCAFLSKQLCTSLRSSYLASFHTSIDSIQIRCAIHWFYFHTMTRVDEYSGILEHISWQFQNCRSSPVCCRIQQAVSFIQAQKSLASGFIVTSSFHHKHQLFIMKHSFYCTLFSYYLKKHNSVNLYFIFQICSFKPGKMDMQLLLLNKVKCNAHRQTCFIGSTCFYVS